jgi:hypothetical protein
MLFTGASGTAGLSIPAITLFMVLLFLVLDLGLTRKRFDFWMDDFPWYTRWATYSSFCCLIWMFGGTVNHPFVYFQF